MHPLDGDRLGQLGRPGVGVPDLVGVGAELGHGRDGHVEPAEHLLGQLTQGIGLELRGAERLGQVRVDLCGRHAEPFGLAREVAAGLARRADRQRAGTPRAPGPLAVAAVQRVQVADAGRGQRPAVRGGPQVAGQDGQDRGRALDAGLGPAVRLGDVRRAELGQRRGDLQVRVRARRDPAEHLEDGRFPEHQAGVALLAGQDQAVQAAGRPGGPPGGPRQVGPGELAEAQRADGPVGHDRVKQRPGQVAVVQPVVDLPPVLRPDPDVPEPGGQPGALADEQLVAIGGRAVRDGDQQVPQARVAGDDLGVGHDREVVDGPPLAGKPPLLDQPRSQLVFELHETALPRLPRGMRPGT